MAGMMGNAGIGGSGNFPGSYGQYMNQTQNPDGSISSAQSGLNTTQQQLNNAQAGAVHDPLQATQLTEANKMSRFNQIYGLLGGQLGNLNGGVYTAGGQNTPPPPISTGPMLNDAQIQQQVNTSRAANDAQTQGQQQRSSDSLAGRGFGGNSPLSQMLNQGYQNNNMATNTANETNTRLNAAQQNASHTLNTQQALSNQWATGNQLDIQRRAPVIQQRTALMQALAGLV